MNFKTLSTIACAAGLMALASCSDSNKQSTAIANDGHLLWFNSLQMEAPAEFGTKTLQIAEQNIEKYWKSSQKVDLSLNSTANNALGNEGFELTFADAKITASANTEIGLLYASYHLLRRQECGQLPASGSVQSVPAYERRVLNHWDNLDGTIERGFAGHSLWDWAEINPNAPESNSNIYAEYARANASVGINGTVLNNVNAKPEALTTESLQKAKVIADQLRPYGIRVYLSINFASPIKVGGLKTADPLDANVVSWWKDKVNEIYQIGRASCRERVFYKV